MTLQNRSHAWKQEYEKKIESSVESRMLRESLMVTSVLKGYNVDFNELDKMIEASFKKRYKKPTIVCEE